MVPSVTPNFMLRPAHMLLGGTVDALIAIFILTAVFACGLLIAAYELGD